MKIKEVISKLTEKQKDFCETTSGYIVYAKANNAGVMLEQQKFLLMGYLRSLVDMGILTINEFTILNHYYGHWGVKEYED